MKTAGRNVPEGFFPQEFEEEEEEDISVFFTDNASPASPSSSDSDESDNDAGEVLPDSPESPPPHDRGRHPSTFLPQSSLPDSPASPVRIFIYSGWIQ